MSDATFRPHSPQILAIVDSRVADAPHLLRGLRSGIVAITLDPHLDGIAQITAALDRYPHITQLHVISHGSPGRLQLGNGFLDLETIDRYSPQLQRWFGGWKGNGTNSPSLLLYGCNVAAGEAGAEFLEKLSQFAGAQIAASATLTGNATLGGDWNLEVRTGEMEVTLALEEGAISSYAGVFVRAFDDIGATNADTILTVPLPGLLANDTGIVLPINSLSPIASTITPGVLVNINLDGSYTYDPRGTATFRALPRGATANDTFSYIILDSAPDSDIGVVTITVTGVNDAPIANPDTETIAASGILSNAPSLLANDTDPDTGETASLVVVAASLTTPQGATVTINPDGTYVYNPSNSAILAALPDGVTATDAFNYTVRDINGATSTGTATITVTGGNETPIANDDNATTLANTPVTINVLTNDGDPDGNPINLFPLPFNTSSAQGGSVTSGSGLTSLTYTPPVNFSGTDTFTYTITDGTSSDTATVMIEVRQPPPPNNLPIANSDTLTVNPGTTTTINVLANDTDADGDALTLVSFTNPNSGGTLVREGNSLTYTPPPNFIGNDGFQYIVQDSRGGRSSGGVFIAVVQPGTPPTPPMPPPGEVPACDILLPTPPPPAPNLTLDTLQGTASDNLLIGNGNGNEVLGLEGNDLIVGLAGNDNLLGNAGDDFIFGNQGTDFLQGGDGNDQMFGGRDNDFLDGNLGDDTISADLGDDSVLGSDGNDVIGGGQGNDVIDGGLGNDAIDGGTENDAIKGAEGNDTLSGGAGADALTGEVGADVLYGNADGDVLDGCSGNDTVLGGQGDDTLFGGTGNDYVDGNLGNNLVFGGAGGDRFVLSVNDGTDGIADFVAGEDTLLLGGGLTIEQIAIVPLTNATGISLVDSPGTFLAVLLGVDSETIGVDNFTTS